MITVYEQINGEPWQIPVAFRTWREAMDAVCGHLAFNQETVGSNGFTFHQDNKCIGVI